MDETIKYAKMIISLPEEMTLNHKYEEGETFVGIHHVCDNEIFWKNANTQFDWEKVMHSRDNEICIDIANGCNPNRKTNCGHYEYSKIYPMFDQSQLQEMIRQEILKHENKLEDISSVYKENIVNQVILKMFHKFLKKCETSKTGYNYMIQFDSIEQLTLVFVMYTKHKMIFRNNEWIKVNKELIL